MANSQKLEYIHKVPPILFIIFVRLGTLELEEDKVKSIRILG